MPCAPSSKAPSSATSIPAITRAERTRKKTRRSTPSPSWPMPTINISELEAALHTGRIIAESQNFTRDLVNEPSNLMTPTILAEHAKKMASEVGLDCEVYGADKIKSSRWAPSGELRRVGRTSRSDRSALRSAGRSQRCPPWPGRQGSHFRHGRHFDQARRWHGEDEIRHGRSRHHDRHHARHRAA